MSHPATVFGPALRTASVLLLAGFMTGLIGGCTAGETTTSDPGSTDAATPARQARLDREARMLEEVEREYAIGPRAARSLGYRLAWQDGTVGRDTKMISPQGDSVFLLSGTNLLQRLARESGTRIWTATVGSPIAEVLGLTYLPDQGRVFVTRDSSIMALESPTGVLASAKGRPPVQDLQWIANTAPVVFGEYFIYGSRAGELVWQAYDIGHPYRAYKVGRSIKLDPVLAGDTVVTAATSGQVMAIEAENISTRWQYELPGQIRAKPAVGPTAVYVASDDQYLRAFDLFSGRLVWRALTEAPLTTSPTAVGRQVFQFIPGTGLACYEAMPRGRYDGNRQWLNTEVAGEVLTVRNDRVLVWNPATKEVVQLSTATGVVEQRRKLSRVDRLISDALENGRLYSLDDRGRLDCLVPLD